MKAANPGAGIWFWKSVIVSMCFWDKPWEAPGESHRSEHSSLEWVPLFYLNGERKYPMPVCCCPEFPEQEGALTASLGTCLLSLFSKQKEG